MLRIWIRKIGFLDPNPQKYADPRGKKISQRRQTKIILLSTPKSELLNLTEIIKMLLPSEYASIRFSLINKMTKKEEK